MTLLIHNAEVWGHGLCDVRIEKGLIAAIGQLEANPGEPLLDAHGGALLPGLHDHHIHLAGMAVRAQSVWCGPPDVTDADHLAARLRKPGSGWIRGIGFHESVTGSLPGAAELDELVSDRPLRMQHRSGRMWLLNSLALDLLLSAHAPPAGLEQDGAGYTGRLFDEDAWLRLALGSTPPDFSETSAELARYGVTGITDMTPQNDVVMAGHFASQMTSGSLVQKCLIAGTLELAEARREAWRLGPAKIHLHEAALPDFDELCAFIRTAHAQDRPIAVHCVSEVELVYTLAAIEAAGAREGDRIEHVSVASPELVTRMAGLGLSACVQPHFVAERGDQYLAEVEERHHPDLYRLASLAEAGIAMAGGSDAPFGGANPWRAMAAAMSRQTGTGKFIGPEEALSADTALALYLADPEDLSRQRCIAIGESADICLLDRRWDKAIEDLASVRVSATLVSGRIVHNRIDQPPVEGSTSGKPAA